MELVKQSRTSKELQQLVDSIEQEKVLLNSRSIVESTQKDNVSVDKLTPFERRILKRDTQQVKLKDTNNGYEIPVVIKSQERIVFECEYNSLINIRSTEKIISLKGIFSVTYGIEKEPKDLNAQITMLQQDDDHRDLQNLTFRLIKAQVNSDNTFNCIFQENPLPALNEFDAQNQRMLSISVKGSFDDLQVKGVLAWNEITGRTLSARITMNLKKKS